MKCFARALVVSTLCLLSFATSAAAECACVLWVYTQAPTGKTAEERALYQSDWMPAAGAATPQACKDAANALVAKYLSAHPDAPRWSNVTTLIGITAAGGTNVSYHCFPDIIDPRGSKGK